MSNSYMVPNEATTGHLAGQEIANNDAILDFINGLTPYERVRFMQIAHHLTFLGFESGMRHRSGDLTEEQQARVGLHKFEIYLKGAAEGEVILYEHYGDE